MTHRHEGGDIVVKENDKNKIIERLAVLETRPIRTIRELLEWDKLRKWVIQEDLIEDYKEYREQEFLRATTEITKVQTIPVPFIAPKSSHTFLFNLWDYITRRNKT